MNILGISAFYHDSAAALVCDGEIIAAAQEERFTRKKHDPAFPSEAIKYCLDASGLTIDQLDAIVFYDKPLLKFERLLETYYHFAPKGLRSFIMSMPVWLREKMFLKKVIKEELEKIQAYNKKKLVLLFPEHHLSHAASTYYPSPYKDSAILTIDGVGEWATASICHGQDKSIKILKELRFPHSLGLLYSAFTYYLGFRVNSGEYKLMGLAPYGNSESPQVAEFVKKIKEHLIDIKADGSVWLNQDYFDYATGLKMAKDDRWAQLFGVKKRSQEGELSQEECNLALAIQKVTEEVVIKMAMEAKRLTGSDNICLSGGVALNCVANGKLLKENIFKNVYIQPAAGDAGGALGAALAAYHIYFDQALHKTEGTRDQMKGSYLGPEFFAQDIEKVARKYKAKYHLCADDATLSDKTASILSTGMVVGWVQGKMEFGPRALGNRSILGDPRNAEMQKKLNLKIKYRESFRPFAPSVLAEDCSEYFDLTSTSPYMLLVQDVKVSRRNPLPANYNSLNLRDKLYFERSDIPSVTHIDFSARIQTVHQDTNKKYWDLIKAFKLKTGYGLLVNTSFNVRGEPIVCTPEDAYRCFMRTEMDYLVMGNFIFDKKEQPEWTATDNWKEEFVLD
jgi:carbamoyltransferase